MKIIKNGDLDILLSQAFQAFWKRMNLINPSPLARISMEENGIRYFIALDLAIGHKKNYKLIGLLNEMVQPPEEFLPIVAEIINGVPNKKGRPNIFTYCTRLSLYYQMCEQSILEGREISTICAQMASEFNGPGEAVTDRLMDPNRDHLMDPVWDRLMAPF